MGERERIARLIVALVFLESGHLFCFNSYFNIKVKVGNDLKLYNGKKTGKRCGVVVQHRTQNRESLKAALCCVIVQDAIIPKSTG